MASERRRFWLGTGTALAAGMLLRLWFIHHMSRVAGDSLVYGDIARNLILHHIYGFTEQTPAGVLQIRPTLIRLPGYPLFLAGCFRLFGMEHYRSVLYVQLGADLLTCWLASALAGLLFGDRARLPVLWLAVLCPFTSTYVATPLTETLVLTSIGLTFYAIARWQRAGGGYNSWLWLISAALAWSILLRPEQGLLAAAVVPSMLWAAISNPARRARPLASAVPVVVAAFCVLLPLIPWAARNWSTFHVFQPLAPRSASDPGETVFNGFNRWYRTWAIDFASTEDVYWNYDGSRIELADIPTRALGLGCRAGSGAVRNAQPLYEATAALLAEYNENTAATTEVDDRFDALARQRINAAPLCYYVAFPVARVMNMMFRPRTELTPIPVEWWKPTTPRTQARIAVFYAAINLVYFILAGLGLWRAWHRTMPSARIVLCAMVASILLRCALLLTLDNSEPRYTLEFFPVLFVLSGALFARPVRESTDN